LGLTFPDDISLVAFSSSGWIENLLPPLAMIRVNTHEMGRAAAFLMADWLNGVSPPDITNVGAAEWVERASIGPVRPCR